MQMRLKRTYCIYFTDAFCGLPSDVCNKNLYQRITVQLYYFNFFAIVFQNIFLYLIKNFYPKQHLINDNMNPPMF